MTALLFIREMVAFPLTYVTGGFAGKKYVEVEEKARHFLISTARVGFACALVWGIYQGRSYDKLRKLTMPVVLLSLRVGRFSMSLEPLSLMIHLYFMKTGQSWIMRAYHATAAVNRVWQCTARVWKAPSVFFSSPLRQAALKIDPLLNLMRIASWKVPESRLGIGSFLIGLGIFQLYVYSDHRWNLREAPAQLALKGIVHIILGSGWLHLYEKYHQTKNEQETYFYRAAHWLAPGLAWLVTGGKRK